MTTPTPRIDAIIMAAGKGTRMGGDLPKVLHEVAGRPMVWWVVKACREAGAERCVLVVGYKAELVREALAGEAGVEFVEQTEQLGTAHAVKMAEPAFDGQPIGDVFVLAGDGPLIRAQTLSRLIEVHRRTRAAATLATAIIDDPTGYGRIVRDEHGHFDAIVEQKDATDDQRAINEVNPSYYCFDGAAMFKTIDQIGAENAQREYYITDAPGLLKTQGQTVTVVDAVPPEDVLSINNPDQLAEVDRLLRRRLGMTPESDAGAQA
ncbi:MAG: NTP transferase domain-containing protein [Phycisphaeraceae bacterium]